MQRVDTLRRPSREFNFKATRPFDIQDAVVSSPYRQVPMSGLNRLTRERSIRMTSIHEQTDIHQHKATLVEPIPIYEQSLEKRYRDAKERLSYTSRTREYINFFNNFHSEEGLPEDWQNLQYGDMQVGFSIKGQMDLLKDDTPESRGIWASQTRRDMQGFIIEYLSPYNVYPWLQEKRENFDGTANLVDARYGGKRMVDTVSDKERGGSVKSVLEVIDQAVVSGKVPDGSMFMQISPQDESPTGLVQDNGEQVIYKDTHLIFSQVRGNKLEGFTVKTDFTKAECRELIKRVSGKIIPVDAPIEDYIRAVVYIDPRVSNLRSVDDLVGVAADVRSDLSFGSKNAYKDKSWKYVLEQIREGEKLYEWTDTAQSILQQSEQDIIRDNPTKEELLDYIAATILRISQAVQIDQKQLVQAAVERGTQHLFNYRVPPNFGEVLKITAAIQGCAGGGKVTSVGGAFGVNRAPTVGGTSAESCPKISCPCGWEASESEVASIQAGILTRCPECKSPPGKGVPAPKNKEDAALAA